MIYFPCTVHQFCMSSVEIKRLEMRMPVYHYDEIKHNHINLALFRHDLLSRYTVPDQL